MYSQNSKTQKKLNKKAILLLLIIIAIFIMLFSSKSPKISIIGDSNVTIELNSNYTDSGAKAKYGSKDISSNIETDMGNFSSNKVGSYTITYTIKKKKKIATATRTIHVVDSIAWMYCHR